MCAEHGVGCLRIVIQIQEVPDPAQQFRRITRILKFLLEPQRAAIP